MSRSSVHLPQPDGPISETNSPCATVEVDVLQRGDLVRQALVEDLPDARASTAGAWSRRASCRAFLREVARHVDVEEGDERRRRPGRGRWRRRPPRTPWPARGGLAGVLEDQSPDPAANAGGDLGDDGADDRRGRARPSWRGSGTGSTPGTAACTASAVAWRRRTASARGPSRYGAWRPRSAPTLRGKKARYAAMNMTDCVVPHWNGPIEMRLPMPTIERAEGDERDGLRGDDEGQQPRSMNAKRCMSIASSRPTLDADEEAALAIRNEYQVAATTAWKTVVSDPRTSGCGEAARASSTRGAWRGSLVSNGRLMHAAEPLDELPHERSSARRPQAPKAGQMPHAIRAHDVLGRRVGRARVQAPAQDRSPTFRSR